MTDSSLSRRDAVKLVGGAVFAAVGPEVGRPDDPRML